MICVLQLFDTVWTHDLELSGKTSPRGSWSRVAFEWVYNPRNHTHSPILSLATLDLTCVLRCQPTRQKVSASGFAIWLVRAGSHTGSNPVKLGTEISDDPQIAERFPVVQSIATLSVHLITIQPDDIEIKADRQTYLMRPRDFSVGIQLIYFGRGPTGSQSDITLDAKLCGCPSLILSSFIRISLFVFDVQSQCPMSMMKFFNNRRYYRLTAHARYLFTSERMLETHTLLTPIHIYQ